MQPEVWFPNIGIEIEKLPRVYFSIFGLDLYYYGLLIGLGILAGTMYAVHEAKRTGQDPDMYTGILWYGLIAAIVGARLYYVIFTWEDYQDNLLKIFATREGGLAIYGGVLAGIATAIWHTKKNKLDFWLFADTAAPSLIIGQAIGRWGNFFNREAFGGYTDSLFAMRYLAAQARGVTAQVADHALVINGAEYIQVHPTFLYESAWCFLVFILINIYKQHKKTEGGVFCLYLAGYGAGRFLIEGLRTDQLLLWGTNLAASQLLSVILVLVGAALFLYKKQEKTAGLN